MKKLSIKALCLLLTLCTLIGVVAGCASEPEERAILPTEGTELNEAGDYVTRIYSEEHDFSNTAKDTVSVKYTSKETEYSATLKSVTVIDKNTLDVTFANEREAELYSIYIEKPYAQVDVYPILPEPNVTLNVESIYAHDNSFRLTLELEEGTYASNISTDCIILGGSLASFKIDSLSASGKNLTVQLSGSMERNPSAGFFVDGTIDIDSSAFAEKMDGVTINVPVVSEPLRFVADSLKVSGGKVTADLAVNDSALLEGMKAEDIIFENGVTVTDLVKGDGIATLTMTVEGAKDANAAAAVLNGKSVTIGDTLFIAEFNAPMFYPVFDYVEANGENLDFTLILYATYGKFNTLASDMITLGDAFADGRVASLKLEGDRTAELVISVPSQGQSVEALDMDGSVSLSAGAMQSLWNTSSEAVSHSRNYSQESMGKDVYDDWFQSFSTIEFDFTGATATSKGSTVKAYLHKVIDIFKGETFSTIVGVASGIASAASGIYTVLQVLGIVDSPMSQINKAISIMESNFSEIQNKLDEMKIQSYVDKISTFYSDISELGDCQATMQSLVKELGPASLGIPFPEAPDPETATEEQLEAYNTKLDAYYKAVIPAMMEADPNTFNNLLVAYNKVTKYFAPGAKSILETYDEYMSLVYAFDAEAYEERDSFRTLIMCQILTAAGTIGLYYKYIYDTPLTGTYNSSIIVPYERVYKDFEKRALEPEDDDKIYCYLTKTYYSRQMVIQGVGMHKIDGLFGTTRKVGKFPYSVLNSSQIKLASDQRKFNVKANVSYTVQAYDDKITVDGKKVSKFKAGDVLTGEVIKVKRGNTVQTYTFTAVTIATSDKGKNISQANIKEMVKRFKANYGSSINVMTILSDMGFVLPTDIVVSQKGEAIFFNKNKTYKKNKTLLGIMFKAGTGTDVNYLKANGSIAKNVNVANVYGHAGGNEPHELQYSTGKSKMLACFVEVK